MSEEKMQYLRSATISADANALEALKDIPGYTVTPIDVQQSDNRTHVVVTPSGDHIHLVNDPSDPSVLKTSNVIKQDQLSEPVPFQDDELVKFANAANQFGSVHVTVKVSDHDLKTLAQPKTP
ncbi:hypothetical protein [Pseudomonas sp. Xaverov 83]|uniref:hypothetical protein n=1 Tax=Pseudomonas sp. Xaverov 83 TaxID=2666087 RepID=UPI001C5A826C|nr:hypothetical protein [Pseudomonas sp. Xaverov 83]